MKEDEGFESSAFFDKGSKVEHSCSPNTSYCSGGGSLRHIAVRRIRKGERLSFSYFGDEVESTLHTRDMSLLTTKFFRCRCIRCAERDLCRPLFCSRRGITLGQLHEPTPDTVAESWTCISCGRLRRPMICGFRFNKSVHCR